MWEVQIDGFTDEMLEFYGWYRLDTGQTFSKFFNPKYDEQPIKNTPPRFILVDDPNDARLMASEGAVIRRFPKL